MPRTLTGPQSCGWVAITALVLACPAIAEPEGMVYVPPGEFWMGSDSGSPEEHPMWRVRTEGYYIDQFEVSNADFAAYVAATGAPPPVQWEGPVPQAGTEDSPVTNVTWFEAMEYAMWAGKRLPTEVEWERAARGDNGRVYPWGDADEEIRRHIADDAPPASVRSWESGASPYGCLHMAGNAWEWTADWFLDYAGNDRPSLHYGRKYKSMRGGGCTYYYGIENSGRCSQRARVVPYGKHDFLGFRCAMDADPDVLAYDPRAWLDEARGRLNAYASPARAMAWERQYADWLEQGSLPIRVHDGERTGAAVRTGVPLPEGWITDASALDLTADGKPVPLQAMVASRWPDGSARWALLDFPAMSGELRVSRGAGTGQASGSLRVERTDDGYRLDTGRIAVEGSSSAPLSSVSANGGSVGIGPLSVGVSGHLEDTPFAFTLGPAETLEVVEAGRFRSSVRVRGALTSADGSVAPLSYDLRISATDGSDEAHVALTLTHMNWRDPPPLMIDSAGVSITYTAPVPCRIRVGDDGGASELPPANAVVLRQQTSVRYEVLTDGERVGEGTRAEGWLAQPAADGYWVALGARDVWRNHPAALTAGPNGLGLDLWAGDEPLPWEGGLAKTWEFVIRLADEVPGTLETDPVHAAVAPAWVAGSGAMGDLLPLCAESLAQIPYWEGHQAESMRRWVRGMPTGLRDYGDAYMGGPYKGENAYANLEYDVPFNFLWQYLRTGELWYLEAADAQAKHLCDIDINHFERHQWKHSPQHTQSKAEFGHMFVRGLLLHYLLTGEDRSRECAEMIGDWIAGDLSNLAGLGNERQIGWALLALTGLYETTGDRRFLDPALKAALHLAGGQSTSGRLDIRWDNRIAFFNGIAMNGLRHVYDATGDERIGRAVELLAERTLGLYPEYACRTLNGFTWAVLRTGDPRYSDILARTWESSVDYLLSRPANAATVSPHSHEFLLLGLRHRLFPEEPLATDIRPESWAYIRPQGSTVEVLIRATEPAAPIVMVLEGAESARADLIGCAGQTVSPVDLGGTDQGIQSVAVALPDSALYRLRLSAPRPHYWQIHHDDRAYVCIVSPELANVENLYPQAHGLARPDATELRLVFEVEGEGYHRAALFDPGGRVAAVVERFIDFEDYGRYRMELTAPAGPAPAGVWRLEVFDARVVSQEGFLPYWAPSPEGLAARPVQE
jgi:iron(II)-dependent oxidoreductase